MDSTDQSTSVFYCGFGMQPFVCVTSLAEIWQSRIHILNRMDNFLFFIQSKCEEKEGEKKWWYRSAGLTGETVGVGQTEEISSLTPTRVQGGVPGHCSRGYKLIAGVSYWPFKQGVAVLFCKSKMSVSGCSINLWYCAFFTDDTLLYLSIENTQKC